MGGLSTPSDVRCSDAKANGIRAVDAVGCGVRRDGEGGRLHVQHDHAAERDDDNLCDVLFWDSLYDEL
jgi:hypothetical protein